ncbi:MAG: hypothetical protein ACYTF1_01060 [Planctomycetota bacterium]|jgi:hypothetical protein
MTAGIRSKFNQNPAPQLLKNPHVTKPSLQHAYKTRWPTATTEEEKRQYLRRPLRCKMVLIDNAQEEKNHPTTVPAECYNICDGGLYAIVTIGYGVAMGQHYNFRINIGERGPEPGTQQVVFQHGKIVRTELLLGESGKGDRIGIGVQLYGHRSGCVPMPAAI